MDEFGENVCNLDGSTEVSAATLATPPDMRAAPRTAGKPARGSLVRLDDEQGRPTPQGSTGRIFVGNAMLFAGYTGGGDKDQIGGLADVAVPDETKPRPNIPASTSLRVAPGRHSRSSCSLEPSVAASP
jgi:acyl-CoA synthetase (AMP-forming)/AMP-acid ligase II